MPPDAPPPLISGGFTASPGSASGIIHWVERDVEALSFPDGAVMTLSQPLPRWAALLDRAAAVIAEEGGVAGHLATVARELGVPAILGAGPLDGLENGREVTVDATGRAVFPGASKPSSKVSKKPLPRSLTTRSGKHSKKRWHISRPST